MALMWTGLLVVISITLITAEDKPESGRTKLVKFLMKNYEKNYGAIVIPNRTNNDTTLVKFGLALLRGTLDEEASTYTADVWFRYQWKDSRLSWDPEEFDGVSILRIPGRLLWQPDIVLYSSVDTLDFNEDLNAVISSDGTVMLIPPTKIKTDCSFDGTDYWCTYKFGSWTFDGFTMDVNFFDDLAQMDVSDYIQSDKYTITSNSAVRNVKYYPCCVEPYPDLTFTLVLQSTKSWWSW